MMWSLVDCGTSGAKVGIEKVGRGMLSVRFGRKGRFWPAPQVGMLNIFAKSGKTFLRSCEISQIGACECSRAFERLYPRANRVSFAFTITPRDILTHHLCPIPATNG